MKNRFMSTISAVLVLVMFAGSTLAFAEPIGDVQLDQFSALQGVQAEPLSNVESEQIKGAINWTLLASLAKMWSGILYGMGQVSVGNLTGVGTALSAIAWEVSNAYFDYKNAKISEKKAKQKLNDAMTKYNTLRKKNPKLPKL